MTKVFGKSAGMKIKVALITILIQATVLGMFFVGFLMDPLVGIWVVGIYFFVIGTFLVYRYLLFAFGRVKSNASRYTYI